MMGHLHLLLAQGEAIIAANPLYAYGPMGVILAWFLLRFEAFLKESRQARTEIIAEFHRYGHKIDGLRIALLTNTVDNPGASDNLRDFCRTEIARIEGQNRQGSGT